MAKIDYKKELKQFYKASAKQVELVEVPPMNFLMIDGKGDPNTSQEFKDAVEALFGLSYTLKFMVKKGEMAIDYGVMPLEGLWWVDDMSQFTIDDKSSWKWTLMIMQPELITLDMVKKASEELRRKKNPVALSEIRFESYEEGKSAQERFSVEHFFETSAKTGDHIQETFEHMALSLVKASEDN